MEQNRFPNKESLNRLKCCRYYTPLQDKFWAKKPCNIFASRQIRETFPNNQSCALFILIVCPIFQNRIEYQAWNLELTDFVHTVAVLLCFFLISLHYSLLNFHLFIQWMQNIINFRTIQAFYLTTLIPHVKEQKLGFRPCFFQFSTSHYLCTYCIRRGTWSGKTVVIADSLPILHNLDSKCWR